MVSVPLYAVIYQNDDILLYKLHAGNGRKSQGNKLKILPCNQTQRQGFVQTVSYNLMQTNKLTQHGLIPSACYNLSK